jgi:protein involved in polysaccharide export with SLBB domain
MRNTSINIEAIRQLLESAEANIRSAKNLLAEALGISYAPDYKARAQDLEATGEVIEGVFNGENMIGADGKEYQVPANYASKSKLVPGDKLKLIVTENNDFIYKQIGPVQRKKLVGVLNEDKKGYTVLANGKGYKVIKAAVTYYKANPGDEVAILIPEGEESDWAAIENVIPAQEVTE